MALVRDVPLPKLERTMRVLDEFYSTYWNGLDVSIYFGDILVDEAVQLYYAVTEQVRPLFSYHRRVADKILHGVRIVQGQFTINYKTPNYIGQILNKLQEERIGITTSSSVGTELSSPDTTTVTAIERDLTLNDLIVGKSAGAARKKKLQDHKEQLWKTLWGSKKDQEIIQSRDWKSYYPVPCNIAIKYGQPEDYTAKGGALPRLGTVEYLVECHIGAPTKTLDDTGKNTLEVYNFIAKDLIQ